MSILSILEHDQAGQVVLEMAEFTLIVKQITEGVGMRRHHRSWGHDWQDHHPLSYPRATDVDKSDPMLYGSRAEGKSQQSSEDQQGLYQQLWTWWEQAQQEQQAPGSARPTTPTPERYREFHLGEKQARNDPLWTRLPLARRTHAGCARPSG